MGLARISTIAAGMTLVTSAMIVAGVRVLLGG